MEFVSIGYGGLVAAGRVIAVVAPDSAPVKRMVGEATFGRKTAAVLVMDSDHVVLSALSVEKLAPRFGLDGAVWEEEN